MTIMQYLKQYLNKTSNKSIDKYIEINKKSIVNVLHMWKSEEQSKE